MRRTRPSTEPSYSTTVRCMHLRHTRIGVGIEIDPDQSQDGFSLAFRDPENPAFSDPADFTLRGPFNPALFHPCFCYGFHQCLQCCCLVSCNDVSSIGGSMSSIRMMCRRRWPSNSLLSTGQPVTRSSSSGGMFFAYAIRKAIRPARISGCRDRCRGSIRAKSRKP